ncbi:TPA: hypothetical protein DEP90_01490 [Patescibacteria group bacterium]|nr:hypothetical protein [Patescibacteria group bacterium]
MNIFNNYHSILLAQAKTTPSIFWDIDKDSLSKVSQEALLERILNYGNFEQLKDIVKRRKKFKKIYKTIRNKQRCNLRPEVINYIDLFLEKYV